jgi:hypothetical protein
MSRLSDLEEEKRIFNIAPLLSHGKFTSDISKEVFQSTLTQMKENYDSATQSTYIIIPFVGKVFIRYMSDVKVYDEIDEKEKIEAVTECFFSPSVHVKRSIGNLVDKDFTDIEKSVLKDITSNYKRRLRDDK